MSDEDELYHRKQVMNDIKKRGDCSCTVISIFKSKEKTFNIAWSLFDTK